MSYQDKKVKIVDAVYAREYRCDVCGWIHALPTEVVRRDYSDPFHYLTDWQAGQRLPYGWHKFTTCTDDGIESRRDLCGKCFDSLLGMADRNFKSGG